MIKSLITVCNEWSANKDGGGQTSSLRSKEQLFRVNDILAQLKGGADQVNLIELVKYLKESHLAQKVSGYAEKANNDAVQAGKPFTLLQFSVNHIERLRPSCRPLPRQQT